MIVHVVTWQVKPGVEAQELVDQILTMKGNIPGMVDLAAGVALNEGPSAGDLAIVTRHENEEALACYQDHPLHQKVKAFIAQRVSSRLAVDFKS